MLTLSIIVPVYNKASYIDDCIQSILHQTFTKFELILVNDGSTDLSGERCRHYAALDERITLIEQANAGVSAARNAGMDRAVGKYIGFVDSDDRVELDMYAILMGNALTAKADISVCRIALNYAVSKRSSLNRGEPIMLDHIPALSAFLKGDLDHNVNNKIYRREILRGITFEGKIYEDILFVCKAILAAKITLLDPAIKYNYIIRSNSASMEGFNSDYLETVIVSAKIVELVIANDRGCLAQAMEFDVMANLSLLNILLLLKDQQTFLKDYHQVVETLMGYDHFIKTSVVVRNKHKYAWRIFKWSPMLYKHAMWVYCYLAGADTLKRIK